MKRTTVALDEKLLQQLKADAARRGTTLARVIDDLLRQSLAAQPRAKGYKLRLAGWQTDLRPGVDILDRDKLFDFMDGT